MINIGIDPGKAGGIAIIEKGGAAYAFKMPDTNRDIFDALREVKRWAVAEGSQCRAVIERVHSSPQMGVVSAFTFGRGYGGLLMALTALEIPFVDVSPQKWQGAIGCMTKGDKNVSKAKAQAMFPTIKITHAIADALLIAEWCRRQK
jgi:Holliday junction resolvasome RuvABC endonuclease subunit